MTQEVEHHLPGAQSFYDRLVSAKGPLEFNAAMEERLQEIDSDAFYHGYVLPAEAAILGIAARIMAENPAVTFQQALDPFRRLPQNFVTREIDELSKIMKKQESEVIKMMESFGFHVEEGIVTHHISMHKNYTQDLVARRRAKKSKNGSAP